MKSLKERKASRETRDSEGMETITDENSVFVNTETEFQDMRAVAAQIDVQIAEQDRDEANVESAKLLANRHSLKADDKARKQAKTAEEDAAKGDKPPVETQLQGAQPDASVTDDETAKKKKSEKGGNGAGWTNNKA